MNMRGFLLVGILWVAGCASPPPPRWVPEPMPARFAAENVLDQGKVTVAVEVKAPEIMPVVRSDGEAVGTYPLADMLREATIRVVDGNFRLPRPGETPPFKYSVNVLSSKLTARGKRARYEIKVAVALLDLYGRPAWRGTHGATAESSYDGTRAPDCVWEAMLAAHRSALHALSADALVVSQLRAPVPGALLVEAPKVTRYECDLRLVDLQGRQVLSVSGKCGSKMELRGLAGTLSGDLLKQWDPLDLPKVAVLDFKTLGDDSDKIGPAFASFVQDAFHKSAGVQMIDRERLALLMQEHNLRLSDLAANPGGLGALPQGVETVDFFVVGQVSVLTEAE